jgi:quercetin dioxygenase-like cupin family protein
MAIVDRLTYQPLGSEDADDYRPASELAFVIDPASPDGRHVRSLSFIFERCAPGEHIPLHRHTTDEAIVIDEGEAEVILGDERRIVARGTVVFIPAGTLHGWGNPGTAPLHAHAVFPTDVIDIEYVERNPAPGTEGDPPQPPFSIDLRML